MHSSLKLSKATNPDNLSTRIKTDLNSNPQNIQQYILLLGQHQKLFEKNGKFIQAEKTKKKALALKKQLQGKYILDMKNQHQRQREEIAQAHQQEMKSFNAMRSKKMEEHRGEMQHREQELERRHEEDLKVYVEELERNNPLKLKESPQLINLRKVMEILAKQENYVEAHKVQVKIQGLEKEQNPRFASEREKKMKNLLLQFKQKQETEMGALAQKLKMGYEEKRKMFNEESGKLKQKYENTKMELEFNHRLEIQKFEKGMKLNKDRLTLSKSYIRLK